MNVKISRFYENLERLKFSRVFAEPGLVEGRNEQNRMNQKLYLLDVV